MTPLFRPLASLSLALLAWLGTAPQAAQAACPTWPTAQRFVLNGAEATDTRTGLVWARCSVGQRWTGSTCMDSVSYFTHQGALEHAQAQSGWRLPTVKELASLADKGCINPSIDPVAFPATPSYFFYWSSSPYAGGSGVAWSVYFYNGDVYDYGRSDYNAARLVRASQ